MDSVQPLKKKVKKKLLLEEWDFKPSGADYPGCSDAELCDCYDYEYSRQYFLFHGREPSRDLYDERQDRFYKLLRSFFPHTPWLLIPSDVRRQTRATLLSEFPEFNEVFRVSKNAFKRDLSKNGVIDHVGVGRHGIVHVTVVPFAISWQFANGEIVEAFSQWIEKNQPIKSYQCKIKTSGSDERKKIRSGLGWLGALRISSSLGSITEQQFKAIYGRALPYCPRKMKQAIKQSNRIISGWDQPMQMFLSEDRRRESHLLSELSDSNKKECANAPLAEWLLRRATPYVARRFLTRKGEGLDERLRLVCERPCDEAASGVLGMKCDGQWEEELSSE